MFFASKCILDFLFLFSFFFSRIEGERKCLRFVLRSLWKDRYEKE